jgi:Zn-dependent protease
MTADLQIAASGPVMHLPMLLFWFVARLAVNGGHATWEYSGHFVADLCYAAMVLNIVLMLFNLLIPAFPLDGGRILIDVLLLMGMSKEGSAKTSIALSSLVAFVLITIGLMSGFSGLTEMFIGAWIAYQVRETLKTVKKTLKKL